VKISQKQQRTLLISAAILVLMALFPPWRGTRFFEGELHDVSIGYGFLFWPPSTYMIVHPQAQRIDIGSLLSQWMIVLGAATVICLLFRFDPNSQEESPDTV